MGTQQDFILHCKIGMVKAWLEKKIIHMEQESKTGTGTVPGVGSGTGLG